LYEDLQFMEYGLFGVPLRRPEPEFGAAEAAYALQPNALFQPPATPIPNPGNQFNQAGDPAWPPVAQTYPYQVHPTPPPATKEKVDYNGFCKDELRQRQLNTIGNYLLATYLLLPFLHLDLFAGIGVDEESTAEHYSWWRFFTLTESFTDKVCVVLLFGIILAGRTYCFTVSRRTGKLADILKDTSILSTPTCLILAVGSFVACHFASERLLSYAFSGYEVSRWECSEDPCVKDGSNLVILIGVTIYNLWNVVDWIIFNGNILKFKYEPASLWKAFKARLLGVVKVSVISASKFMGIYFVFYNIPFVSVPNILYVCRLIDTDDVSQGWEYMAWLTLWRLLIVIEFFWRLLDELMQTIMAQVFIKKDNDSWSYNCPKFCEDDNVLLRKAIKGEGSYYSEYFNMLASQQVARSASKAKKQRASIYANIETWNVVMDYTLKNMKKMTDILYDYIKKRKPEIEQELKPQPFLAGLRDRYMLYTGFKEETGEKLICENTYIVRTSSEALMQLVANSINEDRQGIVQRSLNKITCSYMDLQQAIKDFKGFEESVHTRKYKLSFRFRLGAGQMPDNLTSLSDSLDASILCLASTFYEHLDGVQIRLPAEYTKKLRFLHEESQRAKKPQMIKN